jgi:hypothetical protein
LDLLKHARTLLRTAGGILSVVALLLPTAAEAASIARLVPDSIDRKVGEAREGQAPAGTTLVTPGSDAEWSFSDGGIGGPSRTPAGSYQGFGLAPTGSPAGVGAFHQRIGDGSYSDRLQFGTHRFAGRHLGSISELSYSTWAAPNGPDTNLAPALHLTLDLDGDGFYTGFTADDILIFEPHHQAPGRTMLDPADSTPDQCTGACILESAWQRWDARAGRWVSRRGDGSGLWNGINFESIEHYLARYPSARIATNPASVAFRAGSGWTDVETFIDGLVVDGTTFDFEPTIEAVTAATPSWRFETVGGGAEFLAKWSNDGSHQGIVDGPAFTGRGSLQQVIGATGLADHVSFGTPTLAGTRLDELNDLSYATYLEPGSLRPPVLSLRLDLDGNGVWQNNTIDDTLQYLAGYQTTPAVAGTWQFWPTLSGRWYSRGSDSVVTMQEYLAAHPGATLGLSDASLMVLLGSGYSNVRAHVDAISVNGRLLDLEPAIRTVAPADGSAGWFFNPPLDETGAEDDRQALVNGPAEPPLGVGSLSQRASTLKLNAVTPMFAGKRLRDLTSLSYWTHRATAAQQMPALKIHLDVDGDQMYTTSVIDAVLAFEPVYQHAGYVQPGQGTVQTGVWQRWNALEGGWWVGSGSVTTPSGCTTGIAGPGVCTLEDLLDTPVAADPTRTYGDLTIAIGPSSIDLQVSPVGSPDVAADRLNVNGIVFDFEAAVPARLPTQLDGNRSSDEGYDLIALDGSPESGTPEVEIYGACSSTDLYLYVESANADVTEANMLFDVNANDRWDATQDRVAASGAGILTSQGVPIPGSEARSSYDADALELKLPRSFTSGGWLQYDVTTAGGGRNTGWGTLATTDATRFIPDPCVYTPMVVNGAVPVDCERTSSDLRLVQHLLDRGLGTTIKLSGTCSVSATPPHGGDQVSIDAAAFVLERDGTTVESLDPTNKARVIGSGTQAGFYVAPGTADATIRSLWLQGLSRGVVAHNSIRTTIGHVPPGWQQISPLGNRLLGVADLHEGILAVAAGAAMGSSATTVTVTQGNLQGGSRTYAIPVASGPGEDLEDVVIAGNYISFAPPAPLTPTADVTGVVVRQNGANRDAFGVEVKQNAVGMASSDFPSFNYAGIRIHADSNDPTFAHIVDVVVFKNSLGRLEELNLSQIEPSLPDAGDLQTTGRAGIALGRIRNFVVQGNSIRTSLSAVPGVNMIGGGIVVYDSQDGRIETNSIITIAGADTADEDLGAIGLVDDLMNVFNAAGASGKPTRNIELISNYAGWSAAGPSDFGTQRGIVINGATDITAVLNQMKTTSAESLLISIPISGAGALFNGAETLPAKAVKSSDLCGNWLGTYAGSGAPQDQPLTEVRFGGRTNGSIGNTFPGGGSSSGNSGC